MPKPDLPAIEAAELHVQAADSNVEYAAARLRQGWTRRRRPVTNVARLALPVLGMLLLLRKKRPQARANGLYYMGAMQPVKTNFVMGLLATAVATRAVWVPVLSTVLAQMQRRRAEARDRRRDRKPDQTEARQAPVSRPAAAYGYPGTAGTANVGSDPRVEAGYH